LGVFSEFPQILKGFQERFLDRIFGVFPVTGNGLGDSEKSAVVSLYELLEGGNIPFLASVDKIQVVAWSELCRVCVHRRLRRSENDPFAAQPMGLRAGGRLLAHQLEV
jgi:hypothetical protein